jgi:prepilin-type N-terminal cleavage/methylation domain-containing protein
VLSNKRGTTLIEIMVSLVILLVVSLAVMRMGLVSMSENVKNSMRDEAVNVAEMRLSQLRNLQFTSSSTDINLNATNGTPDGSITRKVRSAAITYSLTRIINDIDANTKLVTVQVAWQYKLVNYSHSLTIILKRA